MDRPQQEQKMTDEQILNSLPKGTSNKEFEQVSAAWELALNQGNEKLFDKIWDHYVEMWKSAGLVVPNRIN